MGFTRVDSPNEYLRISDFDTVSVVDKICYVSDYKSGISAINKGYYRLMIKTVDGVTVPAVIFNVTDFINRGLDVAGLKSKFVKISGTPEIYNGSYSLQVSEVELVPVSKVKDPSSFLGKIPNLDELFNDVKTMCQQVNPSFDLPIIWKSKSYPEILGGQVGGYIKFIWQWMYSVSIYSDTFGVDLQKIFSDVIIYYNKYLERKNLLSVVTDMDRLNVIRDIPNDDSDLSIILIDALQAVLELGKPEHIYSHIIYDTLKLTRDIDFKSELWKSIPRGGVKQLKDGFLKRF